MSIYLSGRGQVVYYNIADAIILVDPHQPQQFQASLSSKCRNGKSDTTGFIIIRIVLYSPTTTNAPGSIWFGFIFDLLWLFIVWLEIHHLTVAKFWESNHLHYKI